MIHYHYLNYQSTEGPSLSIWSHVKHVKVILFSGGFETHMLQILQIMIVLVLCASGASEHST
jgi:hypothetical protein